MCTNTWSCYSSPKNNEDIENDNMKKKKKNMAKKTSCGTRDTAGDKRRQWEDHSDLDRKRNVM